MESGGNGSTMREFGRGGLLKLPDVVPRRRGTTQPQVCPPPIKGTGRGLEWRIGLIRYHHSLDRSWNSPTRSVDRTLPINNLLLCTKCNTDPAREGYKWCLACQSVARASYYRNKDTHLKVVARRRKVVRDAVIQYLVDNPCVDCGEDDPIVLEFDHRGDKTANVSDLMKNGHSLERVSTEIAKCDVVCANCHRRRTSKTQSWLKSIRY